MRKITWGLISIAARFYILKQRLQQYFYSLSKNNNKIKIFCIGSPKTGTTSIYKALKILGYKTVRLFFLYTYYNKGLDYYLNLLKNSSFEAFVDWPLGKEDIYKKIDEMIPNCKYILTIRKKETHKKSWEHHFKNSPVEALVLSDLYGEMEKIEKRNEEIINYFKHRTSRLLIINIIERDGWKKLCNFLEKPIPNRPFPHKNIGKYRKQ